MSRINKKLVENYHYKMTVYIFLFIFVCSLFLLVSESMSLPNNGSLDTSVNLSFNQVTPTNSLITYERVLMQNKEQQELDVSGAGCQWPISLESSNDGNLMLYGIDVAGLYKSLDHGATWTLAASGIDARGVGMFAIDPYNSNHVLALGLGTSSIGGIYVSYDMANTWTKTKKFKTVGTRYLWDGLEFDPTSYDSSANKTMDVYFSIPYSRDTSERSSHTEAPQSKSVLDEGEVGLYKSSDGGVTFTLIINSPEVADGIVKITDNGKVYVGNQYGLFLINKETNEIEERYFENDPTIEYSKGVTGLDVVGNTLYVQTWDGIYTLVDDEITQITNESYLKNWPQYLEVSKSNPNHMIYQYRRSVDNYYANITTVSFDGGSTWQVAKNEVSALFFKSNWEGREKVFIIDPSNDNTVITFALDMVVRSTDAGLNFSQVNGISNMMQGGKFNFNYYEPDLLFFSAQDYGGVISTDGGVTYKSISIPNKNNFYGGFAVDRDTIYGFANGSWNGGTLHYTHDGGNHWIDTGLKVTGVSGAVSYSSLQSPTNPNVLFAAEYISKDKGYTWNKMEDCASVFTFNYTNDKELYGASYDGNLVVSYNNGDTWTKLSDVHWHEDDNLTSQEILDIAYDQVNNYAYLVVQSMVNSKRVEGIYKFDITNKTFVKLTRPTEEINGIHFHTVAVDPNATSVIYVGGAGKYYSSSIALMRSIDGGETWSVLTTNNKDFPLMSTNQGGYELYNIRVNPYDGKVWTANGCYGYETFNPPYDASLLNHAMPADHTIKYMYNDQVIKEITIKNNLKNDFVYNVDGLKFISWYKDFELTEEVPNGTNIFESMTLYAKMEKSIKVRFYDRNKLLWKMDLDKFDLGDESLIPTREGYAFAGWYADSNLTEEIDIKSITSPTSVYAGWYKVIGDVFDNTKKDIGNYIAYSNYKIQDGKEVEDTDDVTNRSVQINVEPSTSYLITFKMDTRFRYGLRDNSFTYWAWNAVLDPYIDPRDTNTSDALNEYVFKLVETGETRTKLLLYYYSWTGTRSFTDIKNTIKVYKLENNDVTLNNERIEGLDYHILDGANQTYTINSSPNASFRADGELTYFHFLEVDGETVDSSNYTLDSGSTVVTLNKSFMDNLEVDTTHTLNIVYKDGGEVNTTFTVLRATDTSEINNNEQNTNASNDTPSPKTNDNILTYLFIFIFTGMGIFFVRKLYISK